MSVMQFSIRALLFPCLTNRISLTKHKYDNNFVLLHTVGPQLCQSKKYLANHLEKSLKNYYFAGILTRSCASIWKSSNPDQIESGLN